MPIKKGPPRVPERNSRRLPDPRGKRRLREFGIRTRGHPRRAPSRLCESQWSCARFVTLTVAGLCRLRTGFPKDPSRWIGSTVRSADRRKIKIGAAPRQVKGCPVSSLRPFRPPEARPHDPMRERTSRTTVLPASGRARAAASRSRFLRASSSARRAFALARAER